jgi:hypothetical protein
MEMIESIQPILSSPLNEFEKCLFRWQGDFSDLRKDLRKHLTKLNKHSINWLSLFEND